jgi:hypothetical protein
MAFETWMLPKFTKFENMDVFNVALIFSREIEVLVSINANLE